MRELSSTGSNGLARQAIAPSSACLEEAFGRRALTERAKGILMERHSIGEEQAFGRASGCHCGPGRAAIRDIAQAVVDGHALLPKRA